MPSLEQILPSLVHVGAIFYLVCFLFRNQIALRFFAILGDLTYTAYYYVASSLPLWSAIYWSLLNVAINVLMIGLILRDQRVTHLDENQLRLFRALPALSPGQFRSLLKLGQWNKAGEDHILTREGQQLDMLYYVLDGEISIQKGDRRFMIGPLKFIGELAYMRDKPASATVRIPKGTVYVSWPQAALKKISLRDEALRNALQAMLSADLAEKLATS